MNPASCSARSAFHSLPGSIRRAATIARQPRAVAGRRAFGSSANGMP